MTYGDYKVQIKQDGETYIVKAIIRESGKNNIEIIKNLSLIGFHNNLSDSDLISRFTTFQRELCGKVMLNITMNHIDKLRTVEDTIKISG